MGLRPSSKVDTKIPSGTSCIYITDGEPGGFANEHTAEQFEIRIPFLERDREYYCGTLKGAR